MDVAKIRITAEGVTDDATNKLKKLDGQVEATGKSTKDFGNEFKKSAMILTGSVAAITTVAAAMKALYEAGREGATIKQTALSFERLEDTLGPNVDLMNELKEASSGTVDEMTIMGSTLTLVAGAGEELQSSLLQAAPELMEIAKAANKLNPTLGDTAFLYESIATGIKRGSPMILDNLGLIIKVGDANEAYAKSLGKTVDELTATEKQMALLNGTMEAGERLISQAGGAAGSAVDPYDQLNAIIKDSTSSMKENVHDGILPLIEALVKLASANKTNLDVAHDVGRARELEIITGDRANDIIREYTALAGDKAWAEAQLVYITQKLTKVDKENADGIKRNESIRDQFIEQVRLQSGEYKQIIEIDVEAEEQAAQDIIDARQERYDVINEMQHNYMNNVAMFTEMEKGYNEDLEESSQDLADVEEELADARKRGYSEQSSKVQDLIAKQEELKAKVKEVEDAHDLATKKIILGYLEQRMAADGVLTGEETEFLLQKGVEWGIYSETAIEEMNAVWEEYSTLWNNFQDKNVTFTMDFIQRGTPGSTFITGGTGASVDDPQPEAVGGSGIVSKPTMFLAGEAGVPEKFSFEPLGGGGGGSSLDTDRIINELRRLAVDIGTETANALIVAEGA